MGFKDRFEEAMGGRGNSEFGRLIGLSKGRITQILQGSGQIGAEPAFRLEDATGYRARWVVLGELPKRTIEANGEMEKLLTRLEDAVIVKVKETFAAVRGSPQAGKRRGDALVLDLSGQPGRRGRSNTTKASNAKSKGSKGAASAA